MPLQLLHKTATSCGIIDLFLKAARSKFIVPSGVVVNIGTVILPPQSEMVQFGILVFFEEFCDLQFGVWLRMLPAFVRESQPCAPLFLYPEKMVHIPRDNISHQVSIPISICMIMGLVKHLVEMLLC